MRMCHIRVQNGLFVLDKVFLVQNIIITFIYLLTLFTVQNFKKILTADPELRYAPFLGPKWPERTDRRKDGRKDGQTLFYRTLPAKDGGPMILSSIYNAENVIFIQNRQHSTKAKDIFYVKVYFNLPKQNWVSN